MGLTINVNAQPNTPATSPAWARLPFAPMRVKTVALTFPDGCAGLVGARVKYRSAQLWPYNAEGWYIGNGQTITFQPYIRLEALPLELTLEVYNVDELYPHRIYLVLDVTFIGDPLSDENRALLGFVSSLGRPGGGLGA